MMTKWRDVPGLTQYKVSWDGQVYSAKSKRQLKTPKNNSGYKTVCLYNKGSKTYFVHELVAMAFLGHKREKGLQIDHIDKDKTNNNVNNLRQTTHRKNNSRKSNLTGVTQISENKYKSGYKVKSKSYHLGYFNCPAAARMAYVTALSKINEL